jgi:hypothetical protein
VTVTALCVAARAAAAVSSSTPASARALAGITATVPAWVGLMIVAAIRAGSPDLADVRGGNAVLGIAVAHGPVLLIAASIAAGVAGVLAIAAAWAPLEDHPMRLALIGIGLQLWLVVTVVAGPQVSAGTDVVPWIAAALVLGVALFAGLKWIATEWMPKMATLAAVVAVTLAVVGPRA